MKSLARAGYAISKHITSRRCALKLRAHDVSLFKGKSMVRFARLQKQDCATIRHNSRQSLEFGLAQRRTSAEQLNVKSMKNVRFSPNAPVCSHFFQAGIVATSSFGWSQVAQDERVAGKDGFDYEVTRTPEDWQKRLSSHYGDRDYWILRLRQTEVPKSSNLWDEERDGAYHCKGCDLHLYDSNWKVPIDKGYAFFRHCVPNALLTGIDWEGDAGPGQGLDILSTIEVHCRRCGSHMGHILQVDGKLLHCINGASLVFKLTANQQI